MDALGPWHLLIIAGVFVLLFGAKRLPDAAKSLGKSAKIFKSEIQELHRDEPSHAAQAGLHAVDGDAAADRHHVAAR